jgi:hypothetical protein
MENKKCNFDIDGKCYAPECFSGIRCSAEKNGYINRATAEEMRDRSKSVFPDMTVMQPTVVNVNGPSKNVAKEGLSSKIEYTPVSESSYDGIRGSFLLDDEVGHFAPQNVAPVDFPRKCVELRNVASEEVGDVNVNYQNYQGK